MTAIILNTDIVPEPRFTNSEVDTAICLFDAFNDLSAVDGSPTATLREGNGTAEMRLQMLDLIRPTDALWRALVDREFPLAVPFDFEFCPAVIQFWVEHGRVPSLDEFIAEFAPYEVTWGFKSLSITTTKEIMCEAALRAIAHNGGRKDTIYTAHDTRNGTVIRSR